MDISATTFDIATFLSRSGDCVQDDGALSSRIVRPPTQGSSPPGGVPSIAGSAAIVEYGALPTEASAMYSQTNGRALTHRCHHRHSRGRRGGTCEACDEESDPAPTRLHPRAPGPRTAHSTPRRPCLLATAANRPAPSLPGSSTRSGTHRPTSAQRSSGTPRLPPPG